MDTIIGTANDDFLFVYHGDKTVRAGKGDDTIYFASNSDTVVHGGDGFDVFEFYIASNQTLDIDEMDCGKTVITISDCDDVVKIVLHNIEDFNYTIEKGPDIGC